MPRKSPSLLDPEMFPSQTPDRNYIPKISKNHLPWIVLVVILIAAGIFAYQQHRTAKIAQQQLEELKKNPQQATEAETKDLLDKVGQLVELPDEQPTIATVTDLAPLRDQPFFARAEVGDKVLIYSQAAKAILYRPSTNKVIEIAPVDLNGAQAGTNSNSNSNSNRNTSNSNRNANTSSSSQDESEE